MAQDGFERRKSKRDEKAKARYNIYRKGGKNRSKDLKE